MLALLTVGLDVATRRKPVVHHPADTFTPDSQGVAPAALPAMEDGAERVASRWA